MGLIIFAQAAAESDGMYKRQKATQRFDGRVWMRVSIVSTRAQRDKDTAGEWYKNIVHFNSEFGKIVAESCRTESFLHRANRSSDRAVG